MKSVEVLVEIASANLAVSRVVLGQGAVVAFLLSGAEGV
jgi:hypothetical protein